MSIINSLVALVPTIFGWLSKTHSIVVYDHNSDFSMQDEKEDLKRDAQTNAVIGYTNSDPDTKKHAYESFDDAIIKKLGSYKRLSRGICRVLDVMFSPGVMTGIMVVTTALSFFSPLGPIVGAVAVGLGAFSLGKMLYDKSKSLKNLNEQKLKRGLLEEIKAEQDKLSDLYKKNPQICDLLKHANLSQFGNQHTLNPQIHDLLKNGAPSKVGDRHQLATLEGKGIIIVGKSVLSAAPNLAFSLTTSILSANPLAVATSLLSFGLSRGAEVKRGVLYSEKVNDLVNYNHHLEHSLGVKDLNLDDQTEVLMTLRAWNKAVAGFSNDEKAMNALKGKFTDKEKSIMYGQMTREFFHDHLSKEPIIKHEVKKPTMWESFKIVFHPRNFFSSFNTCKIFTPFRNNYYKPLSYEDYEVKRNEEMQKAPEKTKTPEVTQEKHKTTRAAGVTEQKTPEPTQEKYTQAQQQSSKAR